MPYTISLLYPETCFVCRRGGARIGSAWQKDCLCPAGRFASAIDPRLCAHVAQLVEHVLGKDEVTGSIPVVGCD
jgi:hypothetical protein